MGLHVHVTFEESQLTRSCVDVNFSILDHWLRRWVHKPRSVVRLLHREIARSLRVTYSGVEAAGL